MARNQTQGRPEKPRHDAEREAAQPLAGQPHDDDDDEQQQPGEVPNFLTAREFQVRDSAKVVPADDKVDADDDDDDDPERPARPSASKARRSK